MEEVDISGVSARRDRSKAAVRDEWKAVKAGGMKARVSVGTDRNAVIAAIVPRATMPRLIVTGRTSDGNITVTDNV